MEKRSQEGSTGQRVSNGGLYGVMTAGSYMVKAMPLQKKREKAQRDRKNTRRLSRYLRERGRKGKGGKI